MQKDKGKEIFENTPNPRDFFNNIQRFLEVGFWYWDRETNHIHFSRKVLTAMGIKADEQGILLDNFFDVIHPDDQKILRKAFNKLLVNKLIAGDIEFRILTKGYWNWTRIKAAVAERNSDGNVTIIFGKFSDIDVSKYTLLPQDERVISKGVFSIFKYLIAEKEFSWIVPPFEMLGLHYVPNNSNFTFDDFKPFISGNEFIRLTQQWSQFCIGNEQFFSFTLIFAGDDRKTRQLRLFASRQLHSMNIVDGVLIDVTSESKFGSISGLLEKNPFLLNLHQLIFLTFDLNGNLTFCNRFAEKMFGYKAHELIDEVNVRKLFAYNPESYRKFTDFVKSNSRVFECRIIPRDGEEKIVAWSKASSTDSVDFDEIIVTGRDITSQKTLEQNYAKLNRRIESFPSLINKFLLLPNTESIFYFIGEQLEKIFSKTISVVFSFDSTDNFATVEGIFGISHKQWEGFINDLGWNPVGRRFQIGENVIADIKSANFVKLNSSLYQIAGGYISQSAAKIIERNFNIEELYLSGLFLNDKHYGGIILCKSSSDLDFDIQPLGDVAFLASLAIDRLQKEKLYEKELDSLKLSNIRKNDLLTHVSHEIRTPLNAILGFSRLLSNSELDEDVRKQYIEIINSKGNTLIRLANDIIDISKIEKGEMTIVKTNCALNKLLNEIYQFYLRELELFKRENIKLTLTMPEDSNFIELFTDEGRLEQVLVNLIDNSLKFTERGTVEFGYSIDSGKVTLFVRDTGIGIDPKIQELIFEKYRKLDSFQSQEDIGLGLKISREIVSLLGGEIRVESQLGVGTTFFIDMSLNVAAINSVTENIETLFSENKVDFKNKVVLIVDDEEVNYLILNELLVFWGATTLWAKNGKEAVELVNTINQTIDLILMDIRMPIMDGYAATMEIKQINPKIPIIAQTAYASDDDRFKAEAAGCNGYITKPIETKLLLEVLEIFL